ncbi:hypothetical protein AC249_AIPGENE25612 [Exaiptasia diaphana]|nr:hypothetical protein AC249_AIPGENE25612 [Exaiptasia diaphana]
MGGWLVECMVGCHINRPATPSKEPNMEFEIVRSEEHNDEQSLQGAKNAKQYLKELLNDPHAGLLDQEIIITVNNKLLGTKNNDYCLNERFTTYMGHLKVYCPPTDIEAKMQTIIDRFNRKSCLQKRRTR